MPIFFDKSIGNICVCLYERVKCQVKVVLGISSDGQGNDISEPLMIPPTFYLEVMWHRWSAENTLELNKNYN